MFSLTPKNLDEAMQLAKIMADSDMVPKDYQGKPGNVLIAVQMGAEIGLKAMQALQNIAVINGRPCVWGDSLLALVKAHPDFVDIEEHVANDVATCKVTRRGETPVVRKFSLADAEKAGLVGKGPWKQYRERMLQMRARGFALRDSFPDALKGISSAEEVSDMTPEPAIKDITPEPSRLDKLKDHVKAKEEVLQSEPAETVIEPEEVESLNFEGIKESIKAAATMADLNNAMAKTGGLSKKEMAEIMTLSRVQRDQIVGTGNANSGAKNQ